MDILLKKWKEAELGVNVGVQGKWKVEVVCPNGAIKKPLGDEWRPNMIQNRGLNLLMGQVTTNNKTYPGSYGGLARTIAGALYGYSATLQDQGAVSYNTNLYAGLGGRTSVAASSRVTRPCSSASDTVNGSRTVTKVYDFNAVAQAQTIREVGIAQMNLGSLGAVGSVSGGDFLMFSRFLIPGAGIVLEQFQYLRLTYSLQMQIQATVNQIPITVQNGGFDGTGKFGCVGRYNDLFGNINSDGSSVDGYCEVPWCVIGRNPATNTSQPGCTAGLIAATQIINGVWDIPTFTGPDVNFAPQNTVAGSNVNTLSAGSSVNPSSVDTEITVPEGSNSISKTATLLFPASNPINGANIGGMFFRASNTTTIAGASYNAGWYWQFTDSVGTLRPQFKDPNYALAVNLSQTISRL